MQCASHMMMKGLMTQIPLLHIENEEEHSHDRSMEEATIYTWQELWIQTIGITMLLVQLVSGSGSELILTASKISPISQLLKDENLYITCIVIITTGAHQP